MRDNFDVLNNFITMWCRGVDERLKFNVRSSQGGCWNLANQRGFGKNSAIIQVDLVKTDKLRLQSIAKIEENLLFGLSKVLAWGKIEETDFAKRKSHVLCCIEPVPPKPQKSNFIQRFWIFLDWPSCSQMSRSRYKCVIGGKFLDVCSRRKAERCLGNLEVACQFLEKGFLLILVLKKRGRGGEGGYVWGFMRWHTSSQNHPTKVHFRHEKMEMGWGGGFGLSEWRTHKTGVI